MANQLTAVELAYFKALTEKRTQEADFMEKSPRFRNLMKQAIDMYSDPAHFVYELIQNADDAGATVVAFAVMEDRLIFSHNGTRRFSISNPDTETDDLGTARFGDINAITGSVTTKSTANKEGNAVGKFGMGFLSVFNYTAAPLVSEILRWKRSLLKQVP